MAFGNSKRERVDSFIRREVRHALQEIAFDFPNDAALLRRQCDRICMHVGCNVTADRYRFRELQDIMDWKKPPKSS